MEDVARHLQVEALRAADFPTRDRFGRSAFNRYYYSTFLQVRAMIAGMNGAWERLPHADYPSLLTGQIEKSIRRARSVAQKLGDAEFVSECGRAISAVRTLSSIMELGSATRVVADYEPGVDLIFNGQRFSLQGVSINDAHEWPEQSRHLIRIIEQCWIQIDG